MAGIDHTSADVQVRERFALAQGAAATALEAVHCFPGVEGCVLLSTCNRTELYLSWSGEDSPDTAAILCDALGLDASLRSCLRVRENRAAVMHLMMVAGALRSQVRGEDQILAQVKAAIELARERRCCDAALQTLFRLAVTGGKKVKSEVRIARDGSSVAARAVQQLARTLGGLAGCRVLVVGNGETGRLAARLLLEQGAAVTMTLRSFKRGAPDIPDGCASIPYDERYTAAQGCDAVVSATASPHHTLTCHELQQLDNCPRCLVDLAVPRDIDPGAAALPNVRLFNVDDLSGGELPPETAQALLQARQILDEQAHRFEQWSLHRAGALHTAKTAK